MVREITEVREVVKTNETVVVAEVRKCDVCGKIIFDSREQLSFFERRPYWDITTGHHDWGNDSVDSIKNKDVCSKKCLQKVFDEYLNGCGDRGDSMYLRVSHTFDQGEL